MSVEAQPPQRKRLPSDRMRLYSIDAVAEMLGVSSKTVRRLIAIEEFRIHRIGRQIRISEADLAAYLARSRCS
jgi:excisionase family DNA binding protein